MKKYIVSIVILLALAALAWLAVDYRKASQLVSALVARGDQVAVAASTDDGSKSTGQAGAVTDDIISPDAIFDQLEQDLQEGDVVSVAQLQQRVKAYTQLNHALESMPPDKAVVLKAMMTQATLNTVSHNIYHGTEEEVNDTCALMEDIQAFLPNDLYPILSVAKQLGYMNVPEVPFSLFNTQSFLASKKEAVDYIEEVLTTDDDAFLVRINDRNKQKGLESYESYRSTRPSVTWELIYSDPLYVQLLSVAPRMKGWAKYYMHCTYRSVQAAGDKETNWVVVATRNPLVGSFYSADRIHPGDNRFEEFPKTDPEYRIKTYFFERVK